MERHQPLYPHVIVDLVGEPNATVGVIARAVDAMRRSGVCEFGIRRYQRQAAQASGFHEIMRLTFATVQVWLPPEAGDYPSCASS